MKLHDFSAAPNGFRVRIFMAEKGLNVPTVEVAVRDGVMFKEPYRSMNPFAVVPFLELEDGSCIGESVAISRYLEDLHPEPYLMGSNPKERAIIEMWNRRMELDGYMPVIHALRNGDPSFQGRVLPGTRNDLPQIPAITQRGKESLEILLEKVDNQLAGNPFIAGESISIADITGYMTIQLAGRIDVAIPNNRSNVARWFDQLNTRPSFQD